MTLDHRGLRKFLHVGILGHLSRKPARLDLEHVTDRYCLDELLGGDSDIAAVAGLVNCTKADATNTAMAAGR